MRPYGDLLSGVINIFMGFSFIFFNELIAKGTQDLQYKVDSYLVKKIPFYKHLATGEYPLMFLKIPFFLAGLIFSFIGILMVYRFFK